MGNEPWETQGAATKAIRALPSQLCLRGDFGISKPGHMAAPRGPKRDWGVGQPGPASYQLCDKRQAPRCSSPPAPGWPFRGTDRIRSPPRVREKPGPDHLAQSPVTVNARDIGAQKGSSEERHSQTQDSHLKNREDSCWGKSIYKPRHGSPPLALLLPLTPAPAKDTLPAGKCHLRGALAPTGGGHSRPTNILPSLDSPPRGHPPRTGLLSLLLPLLLHKQ